MSELYTRIVSTLIFPLHEYLKKHQSVSLLKQLEKTQWLSQAEIEKLRIKKLALFLKQVYQTVPYYRQVMDEKGIDADKIESLQDLQKFPFLTKEIIRKNTKKLTAENAESLKKYNTGGSSGEPLVFYIGRGRVSHDVAAKWRATRWWDVDIGDRELVVWGSPVELGAQDKVRIIRDKIIRSELISAFDISQSNTELLISKLVNFKPTMLFGYPSSIALIAQNAEKQKIRLDKLGTKVVFVTSEKLYDHQREKIENSFNCPVANGYGGRDAGFIAHQCPAGGMHITAEDIIVEIVDTQGNVVPVGQSGEIVVTNLSTREFPFIRYKIGDIGALSNESCKCGRGLPLLADIQGRSTDFIVTPDGRVMHGLALIYILRDIQTLKGFKIIQESKQKIEVQIEVGASYGEKDEARIMREFTQRLGNEIQITLTKLSQIEREKSGKFRYVISKVNPFE